MDNAGGPEALKDDRFVYKRLEVKEYLVQAKMRIGLTQEKRLPPGLTLNFTCVVKRSPQVYWCMSSFAVVRVGVSMG